MTNFQQQIHDRLGQGILAFDMQVDLESVSLFGCCSTFYQKQVITVVAKENFPNHKIFNNVKVGNDKLNICYESQLDNSINNIIHFSD